METLLELSQQDYYKLLYHPYHHHFSRDFAVLFDTPIDGACGLMLLYVNPFGEAEPATIVQTIDCDVNPLETRAVISETTEQL